MTNAHNTPEQSQLGKPSAYVDQYDASLLFPIPRAQKRQEIGVPSASPFFGADIWTRGIGKSRLASYWST